MMSTPFVSICIPSYNRPTELLNLLVTIDCHPEDVEIVICEDLAPKRQEVRAVVASFTKISDYTIHYHENDINRGFDGNLRRLVECASAEYIIFMGDDDLFVPGALSKYIEFLHSNRDKPYVLRSYLTEHPGGRVENFRYLPKSAVLPSGEASVAWLFKRSVSLCGFTISREKALRYSTTDLDGTLLYQVYLMAEVCLKYDSVYCDIPFAHAVQSFRHDKPMFGNSEAEKRRFTPGSISHNNSINFAKAYFDVTQYLDRQNDVGLTRLVRIDLSKYSYPFLSIQRKHGVVPFIQYARRLEVDVGLGRTVYFHFYKWALVLLGERACDWIIASIKLAVGHTPNF